MTQIINADPIEPDIDIIPVGEINIPDPIIVPTTSDIPPHTVIFLCNLIPSFPFSLESPLTVLTLSLFSIPAAYSLVYIENIPGGCHCQNYTF